MNNQLNARTPIDRALTRVRLLWWAIVGAVLAGLWAVGWLLWELGWQWGWWR